MFNLTQKPKAILATISLVAGVLALLAFFVPFAYLGCSAVALSCALVVLLGHKRGKERTKSAIVLVVLGGVLLALWFVVCFFFMHINIFAI